MPTSKVAIWNLALTNCGFSNRIQAEDEGSEESDLFASLHDHAVEFVLADMPWRFAKRVAQLSLLDITPPGDWTYAYERPSDCVNVRGIYVPGLRNPPPEQRQPYERMTDGTYDLICTDVPDAQIVYTSLVTDTSRYDASFTTALSFYLASLVVIPLRGKPDLAQAMQNGYAISLRNAGAKSLNEAFFPEQNGTFLGSRDA